MKISDLKVLYYLIEIAIMARLNARKAKREKGKGKRGKVKRRE